MTDAHRHDPDPTVDAGALVEVVDGVHAWVQPDGTWWINNAGAVCSGAITLIVDTCATAARTRRFLGAVAAATDGAPVRYAVNTHEHGDHTYGNWLLPEACVLFGHPAMRANLSVDVVIDECPPVWDPVPDWGAERRRLPDVTVTGGTTVHLGDRVVEVHHPGHAAHTTGDLLVWLPEERVLFTGDLLFNGLTPLVMAGSVTGALSALAWIAMFDPAHVVPGHGPLVAGADLGAVLADHERYYAFVIDLAARAVRDRLGPLDAVATADLGEFASWDDAERIVLNLHRAIAEAGGPPFDVVAAFGDAMVFNGGPLTTHVCCTN